MRTEQEMLDLILGIARAEERVRAVYLNGSRANPHVAKDPWRDFDAVFVVTEPRPYVEDPDWPARFGEIAIVQEPDRMDADRGESMDFDRSYTWLMLFRDGNRIDLHMETVAEMQSHYGDDSLTVPLLDKDGILPMLPPSDDVGYYVTRPAERIYQNSANEFWWCLNNVGKGLVRGQIPYSMWMFREIVCCQLERMTEWYIAAQHDFRVNTGMHGKYFVKYLSPDHYARYLATYPRAEAEAIWEAVFTACGLFSELAHEVGKMLGYSYIESEEEYTKEYLRRMYENMPK